MTATLHDILLTADDIVAQLHDQRIYAITIHEKTVDGVFAHVSLQFKRQALLTPRGALLDLAARIGLEQVELHPGKERRIVRGQRDGIIVELFA